MFVSTVHTFARTASTNPGLWFRHWAPRHILAAPPCRQPPTEPRIAPRKCSDQSKWGRQGTFLADSLAQPQPPHPGAPSAAPRRPNGPVGRVWVGPAANEGRPLSPTAVTTAPALGAAHARRTCGLSAAGSTATAPALFIPLLGPCPTRPHSPPTAPCSRPQRPYCRHSHCRRIAIAALCHPLCCCRRGAR